MKFYGFIKGYGFPAICLLLLFPIIFSCNLNNSNGFGNDSDSIKRVLIIGWDGVQRNDLKKLLYSPCRLPNLNSVINEGSIVEITVSTGDTVTKPGWAQILTGYDPEYMGVYGNGFFSPVPEGYSIFERANNLFGEENVFTFMITAKKANLGSLGPDNSEDPSIKAQPYYNTVKSIDVWHGDKYREMDEVMDITLSVLEDYAENHVNKHFVGFVYFIEPDSQEHKYG
jgi:predicted AlkP superfamily pyrophosphatase or phosphodiesterase